MSKWDGLLKSKKRRLLLYKSLQYDDEGVFGRVGIPPEQGSRILLSQPLADCVVIKQ